MGPYSRTDSLVVLLIEDDPAEAGQIWRRLRPTPGHHIGPVNFVHSETLAGARSVLATTAIDVSILDLSLPESRGLGALRQLRTAAPGVPVVVLAERADESLALDALRAGAQDYLLKPLPEGASLWRILSFARERQHLLRDLGVTLQQSATAARRWRVLADVCNVLGTPSEPSVAIGAVSNLIVPEVADCFIVWLMADDEVAGVAEAAHVDAKRATRMRQRLSDLHDEANTDEVLTLLANAFPSNPGATAGSAVLAQLGLDTGLIVPLRVGEQVRGFVALCYPGDTTRLSSDVEFGTTVADRIDAALKHARLFQRTQRALQARDRAVGIVSHDLRNPLSTIQICATALLDPDPPHVKGMRHMAQIIQRSAAWMEQIVQDLLDRTSLDAGRLSLDRRPTDVSELVAAAQVMFAPLAEEQSLDFIVENAMDLPRINADPRRLMQVLSNLLNNAMKFTPSPGQVVLSAVLDPSDSARHDKPKAVRFAVTDTGPGISGEDLVHVFDWFWQSPREGGKGAGLGLAIAQGLVQAHGSQLHVESTPGHGSMFWFAIPACIGS